MRICSRCKASKQRSQFYVRRDGRQTGNLSSRCKPCVKEEAREALDRYPEKQMINAAKHRAKKNLLRFDLDQHREKLRQRLSAGVCELTGLRFRPTGSRDWDSPSIDRIDPDKGYIYSNVRIILWSLNSAFGYWGEDQFAIVAKAWLEKRK